MTSQYVTEPPTSGSIMLVTSKGTVHVELWAKEAPRACRNLLTLAHEGFYDNQIFHRLVPGFIIQTGDPSGTGMSGESIYGEPYPVEPHSRLKFNRRGIVAMAAEDGVNESQFFLTLDTTPELQGKHTIIGRVVGNTICNLLDLAQCEMDKHKPDTPRYPIRLETIQVLSHPFDDLKPRFTKESRLLEEKARKEAAAQTQKEAKPKVKKNTALLSFGGDEEADGPALKGPKSSHDLLQNDKKLSKQSAVPTVAEPAKQKPKSAPEPSPQVSAAPAIAPKSSSSKAPSSTEDKIKALEADIRNGGMRDAKPDKPKPSYLAEARSKYTQGKKTDKTDAYDALLAFQSRMRTGSVRGTSRSAKSPVEDEDEEEGREYGASDDDEDWRFHRLDAGGQPIAGNDKYSIEDYEVLDPREHASVAQGSKDKANGKRGRDWVEDKRTYRDARPRDDHREPRPRDDNRRR